MPLIYKLIFGLQVMLLVYLQYLIWQGDNNLWRLQERQSHLSETLQHNERKYHRNESMQWEIESLKVGYTTLEEKARMELGMVREGETFYVVSDDDSGAHQSEQNALVNKHDANSVFIHPSVMPIQ